MRQIRPERFAHGADGFTLIEMVIAIVLVSIIVATTIFFVYPVREAADLSTRAELTDTADNALQRIGREVRLALPNSVRQTTSGSSAFLEFLPVRTAGRYRADVGGLSSGSNCPDTGIGQPASDQLSFDPVVDTCFKTIGTLANAITVTANDFLVLNNYGTGFTGQNAYDTSGTLNRRQLSAAADEGTRERISFTSATAFDRTLHDSAGKRFYIVVGNASTALPEAVTYECAPAPTGGTLTRRWAYAMTTAQPIGFGSGSAKLIADNVTACNFDYDPNGVAPQVGLLTLKLTLSKTLSGGEAETVTLYHAVHVSNVP